MLLKTHIIIGVFFSVVLYFILQMTIIQTIIVFLSSVLIDFDHYIWYVMKKKDYNIKRCYTFFKKVVKEKHKPMKHIFHTLEVLFVIVFFGIYFHILLLVAIGMLFHSLLDLINLVKKDKFECRIFSLFVKEQNHEAKEWN